MSKKKPSKIKPRKQKAGDAYQEAVALVAKSIFAGSRIEIGVWIQGPDGRRDLDVVIHRDELDLSKRVVIECKDWNKPIGIGIIDALESKRRDIGTLNVMICSNSGFTADAIRKASRVGIPVLAALIKDDDRIKVIVREQIYTRIINFHHHAPLFYHPFLTDEQKEFLADSYTNEYTYKNKSIESWVSHKLMKIGILAINSQIFTSVFKFKKALRFKIRGINIPVTQIDINGDFTVQWMTQMAEIDASQGMYDYLRQGVVMGLGNCEYQLKNINTETWGTPISIDQVPPRFLQINKPQCYDTPVMGLTLSYLTNMPTSDPQFAADLGSYILSEENNLRVY